jgi:hypothetical protein
MKENKCNGTCASNECICEQTGKEENPILTAKTTYSIEQIEKAIDDLGFIYDNVKEAIINNLTK